MFGISKRRDQKNTQAKKNETMIIEWKHARLIELEACSGENDACQ